jgi:hypothetical protein
MWLFMVFELIIELGTVAGSITAIIGVILFFKKYYDKSLFDHKESKEQQEEMNLALSRLEILFLIHVKASDEIVAQSYDNYKKLGGNSFIDGVANKYLQHDESYHDSKQDMKYFNKK